MHALMQHRGVKVGVKRLRAILRFNGIIGYLFFNEKSRLLSGITALKIQQVFEIP